MLVVNLVSWGGPNFAHDEGDEIELPDDVAEARIRAGLAAPPSAAPVVPARTRRER